MATKIVSVSELKRQLASLMAEMEVDSVPFHIVHHGKPRAVLVQYDNYEALLRKVEDLEDTLAMKQALSTPQEEAISLAEYESQRASPQLRR